MSKKLYYSISEVSDLLQLPISTLRYWEKEFEILRPKKSAKGTRFYTNENINVLKMIQFLLKKKKMTLEGAKKEIETQQKKVSNQLEVIDKLKKIKQELLRLQKELD